MNNPFVVFTDESLATTPSKSSCQMAESSNLSAFIKTTRPSSSRSIVRWRKMYRRNTDAFQDVRSQCQINFQQQRNLKRNQLLCEKRNVELNNIKLDEASSNLPNNTSPSIEHNQGNGNTTKLQLNHNSVPACDDSASVLALCFKAIKSSSSEDELCHILQQVISHGILDNENSLNNEKILQDFEIIAFMAKVLENINRNDIVLSVLFILQKLIVSCDIFVKYILSSSCPYSFGCFPYCILAIPKKLLGLLHNSNITIVEVVVGVIGNLMMRNTDYRNQLISSDETVHVLTSINRSEATHDHIKQVLWICCSLCSSKDTPPILEIYYKIVPIISFALDYNVELLIERNCILRTIEWLQSGEKQLEIQALHVMGELVAHDEKYVRYAINIRLLDEICFRIDYDDFFVLESLFFIVSNLADTNPFYIQLMINSGIIEAIFDVMDKFIDRMPNLISWTLCNFFTKAQPKQAKLFINLTYLLKISQLLNLDIVPVKVCALNTIISILEVAKCLELISELDIIFGKTNILKLIENCQHHPDNNVYLLSREIIENYCSWDSTEVLQYDLPASL